MSNVNVSSGQTVTGGTVGSLDSLTVQSGGAVVSATLSGGYIYVSSGGKASSTAVSGGYLNVSSGANAFSTAVDGGYLTVQSGGSATATTVYAGFEIVSSGGSAVATLVDGGIEVVRGFDSGSTLLSGSLEVLSGGTAAGGTIDNGLVILSSGGSLVSGTVASNATVLVYSGGVFADEYLAPGANVDVGAIAYAAGASATLNPLTDVLTISAGGMTTTLQLAGDFTNDIFDVSPGLPGVDVYVQSVACYVRATLILTAEGERAVETLSIGDRVVTASGAHRAIRWIGRRSYAGRFLTANPNIQPVRFRAGSLGGGLPRRDLLVSPEHAMFLEGVLIPAKLLVNDDTIVACTGLAVVDYIHIELDSHDVILAEGAPSETFVDCDSRGVFQNAHTFVGDAPRWAFYAPRVEDGPVLARIRDGLRPGVRTAAPFDSCGSVDRATHEECVGWS